MGLFDKLSIPRAARTATTKPDPVPPARGDDPLAVHAPVSGRVVKLDEVSDPVFAQGLLGCGVGIRAQGDVAFSPVSGTVIANARSKHALLIRTEAGAEVLLHVGVDSVSLRGAGFSYFVEKGAAVRAGDPVMSFDRALMAARGLDDTVVVTLTNPDAFAGVDALCEKDEVSAGSVLLRARP